MIARDAPICCYPWLLYNFPAGKTQKPQNENHHQLTEKENYGASIFAWGGELLIRRPNRKIRSRIRRRIHHVFGIDF